MRQHLRTRHYSIRTEQAYIDWARKFILLHDKRHPQDMGAREVEAFLTHLAVDRQVSASTQNQAKVALVYGTRMRLLEAARPRAKSACWRGARSWRARAREQGPGDGASREPERTAAGAVAQGAGAAREGSGGWPGAGLPAARAGREVPEFRPRLGLTVGVSVSGALNRPAPGCVVMGGRASCVAVGPAAVRDRCSMKLGVRGPAGP